MNYNKMMNKEIILILMILLKWSVNGEDKHNGSQKPCPYEFKCASVERNVWATDDKSCFLFRNACYFELENCNRLNNQQKELKRMNQKECQPKCNRACTKIFKPVCGEYHCKTNTFSNLCEMETQSCLTGQSYVLQSEGTCK